MISDETDPRLKLIIEMLQCIGTYALDDSIWSLPGRIEILCLIEQIISIAQKQADGLGK